MKSKSRAPQICILGSAEPGSRAYELAGAAGELLARRGVTVVSGCGSPAGGAFSSSVVLAKDERPNEIAA